MVQALAVAGLAAAAGAAQATITVYTSLAEFTAALTGPSATDTFSDIPVNFQALLSPVLRTVGPFTYEARVTGNLFAAGTSANPALSTNTATDPMTFTAFTGMVNAFGGNFYGTDMSGGFQSGAMTLVATDATGATSTQTIALATTDSFLGFVSTTGLLTSVVLTSIQPAAGGFLWPTADNVILAAVPEPETYALMLAGLGLVGFMARRRHAA